MFISSDIITFRQKKVQYRYLRIVKSLKFAYVVICYSCVVFFIEYILKLPN